MKETDCERERERERARESRERECLTRAGRSRADACAGVVCVRGK